MLFGPQFCYHSSGLNSGPFSLPQRGHLNCIYIGTELPTPFWLYSNQKMCTFITKVAMWQAGLETQQKAPCSMTNCMGAAEIWYQCPRHTLNYSSNLFRILK